MAGRRRSQKIGNPVHGVSISVVPHAQKVSISMPTCTEVFLCPHFCAVFLAHISAHVPTLGTEILLPTFLCPTFLLYMHRNRACTEIFCACSRAQNAQKSCMQSCTECTEIFCACSRAQNAHFCACTEIVHAHVVMHRMHISVHVQKKCGLWATSAHICGGNVPQQKCGQKYFCAPISDCAHISVFLCFCAAHCCIFCAS